jgi:hypothetical protein
MIDQIKTLSDKSRFEEIFNRFFINSSLLLRLKGRSLPAKFLGYTNGQAGFRVPDIKNVPDDCTVEFKNEQYTIYLYLKFIEKQEDDVFIFLPLKFQFIGQSRLEERIPLDDNSGKKIVYVTNIISDFIIHNILTQRLQVVDKIKDAIMSDMEGAFESVKIYLINEGVSDPRMKYFSSKKTPVYIADVTSPESSKDKNMFQYYMKNIYASDISLKHKNFISEASVPFLYKTKMPYGYIQINGTLPMSKISYNTIKKYSAQIDDMFRKADIFSIGNEKFIVNSFSKQGFGIVFNEKKFIRYFKEGSKVYLDMNFPDQTNASILATVKHITYKTKHIAIGFIIDEIDALSEVNYDNFLKSLAAGKG